MSNVLGISSPPIQATGPESLPQGAIGAVYGISAPGSVVGTPPVIDPVVGTLYAKLKSNFGIGNK